MLLCEHIERYVMGGPSVCAVEDSRSLLPNQYFLARFTHQMRVKKNERFVVKQKKKQFLCYQIPRQQLLLHRVILPRHQPHIRLAPDISGLALFFF